MTEPTNPNPDELNISATDPQENVMDDWASALAEQTAASIAQPQAQSATEQSAASALFQPLQQQTTASNLDLDTLRDVPVQITVELGRARMTIRELLQLGQGSVVELMGLAGEPLDILINGHLIAQGEVVVVGDNYGVRLTDILTPSDRLQRLTSPR